MNHIKKNSIITLTLLFIATLFLSGCHEDLYPFGNGGIHNGNGGNGDGNNAGADCTLVNPSETVSVAEIDLLKYMREEEKLARDVYLKMYDIYGVPVFNHIPKSEQKHMDRIGCLLDFYGIDDPALAENGVFTNPDLQALYDAFIVQGSVSLVDAFTVGATIEDVDIYDLEEYIQQTDNPAIINVFESLTCGSRNHMRAFVAQLTANSATYSAQFISQDELQSILTADHEFCGQGNGNGNGHGG